MIEKCFEDQWTYDNGGNKRQLDYCLIDADRTQWVEDAGASDDIGIGTDHLAVTVTLAYGSSGGRALVIRREGAEQCNVGRRPMLKDTSANSS